MEMTAPGSMSAGLNSIPEDPVDNDRHHQIGESYAVSEALATNVTDEEDNRVQQNQDIPSIRGQERASDREGGGRVNVDYEPGSVDTETLWNENTNGGKGAATSTGLHCDGADTEHNRTQQNPPSSHGQDGEQVQEQAQEQAQEQKLRQLTLTQ